MKLLILVIASRCNLYDQLIVNYWYPLMEYVKNNYQHNIQIYLVYGNITELPSIICNNNHVLRYSDIEETTAPGIYLKTIRAIHQLSEVFDYDFLFRTNLSSFIIISELVKTAQYLSQQHKKIYAGIIGYASHNKKYSFISGSGCLMSKNVTNKLIKKHKKLSNYGIDLLSKFQDDVIIGLLLNNVPRITTKRLDIHNNSDYLDQNRLKSMSDQICD